MAALDRKSHMICTSDRFTGNDGVGLHAQSWTPSRAPRAAIALVHGLIEHSGRHARTATELVRAGYAVHAFDLRGHGRSDGPRGYVRSFQDYLLDVDIFMARVREKAGDLPLFLMGNSMGGLIVATWTAERNPAIDGAILTGPLLALADGLFPRLRYLSGLLSLLGPRLHVPRIPFQWLSRDPAAVDDFRNDPLVCPYFTVRVATEAKRAMKALTGHAAELTVPLLILHGSDDRICNPAGSRDFYRKAASADKTMYLYDGLFHEVLDEPERDRVLADLLGWLAWHGVEQGAGSRDPGVPYSRLPAPCPLPSKGGSNDPR